MTEIRIANYTLLTALLIVMAMFCVSFQTLTRACDLNQYESAFVNYR